LDFAQLSDADITVADITGKTIHTQSVQRVQDETVHFSMENQAAGVYVVTIKMSDKIITKQFVLEN
jgi:hypothetical protein